MMYFNKQTDYCQLFPAYLVIYSKERVSVLCYLARVSSRERILWMPHIVWMPLNFVDTSSALDVCYVLLVYQVVPCKLSSDVFSYIVQYFLLSDTLFQFSRDLLAFFL